MGLVAGAAGQRNLAEWHLSGQHQLLRVRNTPSDDIGVRRHPVAMPEGTGEVPRAQARDGSQLLHLDRLVDAAFDVLHRALELPGGEPALNDALRLVISDAPASVLQ